MEGKIRKNEKSRESLTCFSFIFSVGWTSVGARLNAGVGLCCWAGSGAPSALCLADDALTSVDDDIVTSQLQSSWRHNKWGVVTSQSQPSLTSQSRSGYQAADLKKRMAVDWTHHLVNGSHLGYDITLGYASNSERRNTEKNQFGNQNQKSANF